jgi:opacity protein-like surface antigen
MMVPMRSLFVVASLFVAATAYAQAPGEMAPQAMPAPAPVMVAPVAAPCTTCIREPVMANRWSVGLSVGSMGLSPKDTPDDQSNFAVGELSIRFRATPHVELALAFGGGGEKLSNDMDGQREVSMGALQLRYRFMPEHHWNWYLMAGIGGASITQKDATDQERKDAQRGMFQLGGGLEYRFQQFALNIEVRGMGLSETKASQDTVMVTPTTGASTEPPPPPSSNVSTGQYSGGQLTLGASYYF